MQHIHIIFIVVHTLIVSNLQTLTLHSSVVVMVGCFCCSPKNAATDAFLLPLIMNVELESSSLLKQCRYTRVTES